MNFFFLLLVVVRHNVVADPSRPSPSPIRFPIAESAGRDVFTLIVSFSLCNNDLRSLRNRTTSAAKNLLFYGKRHEFEAFDVLWGDKYGVWEILLQTLSMKLLSVSLQGSKPTLQRHGLKEKTYSGLCSTKPYDIPASNSSGVSVRGLEDEFSEVRSPAFNSLHTLSILSAYFSGEAVYLLVDVLNDDSMVVRLQALETLCCMVLFNHLEVQETNMHMVVGNPVPFKEWLLEWFRGAPDRSIVTEGI
ncbi:hypothetical protein RHMOL_Rhmol12G0224200 [Rhododendron molle]|uniref:Uncharacterized protein n=1 Tax=Rhododendron molle TaxID=49168 RepID=A0ACC0LM09_RHOML|nr:hypothetical protein RHMOL_Rhmol12G0224200 [Rhododendron molle]